MSKVEDALADLGLSVPEVAKPVAVYIPAVRSGHHVFTSGQLPMRSGELARYVAIAARYAGGRCRRGSCSMNLSSRLPVSTPSARPQSAMYRL